MNPLSLRGALAGALALLLLTPVVSGQAGGVVVYKADAAWLDAETRIAPAYVTVRDGEIQAVSARAPRGGRTVELAGTLAAGFVDAWSGLLPGDLLAGNGGPGDEQVRDGLPVDLAGADPQLAARVAAARAAGVAAAYLPARGSGLQRGLGTTVVFSANDLPTPAGLEGVDMATGSGRGEGVAALTDAGALTEALVQAETYREAREDWEEKLEKHAKDLEEYAKKLDEYVAKKAKGDKEKKDGGGAPGQDEGDKKDGNGKTESGPPKRPERPKEPSRNAERELLLRVLDGELPLRVHLGQAHELRELIAIKERFELDRVIAVGAEEADLLARELAAAEIAVVLAVAPQHGSRAAAERSLAVRYRRLTDAGVEVALASGGSDGAQGLLLLRAGELIAAGADPAAVWASLTEIPARLLGLEGSHGRIARGARAELVLFQGASPFDASAPFEALPGGRR
ncbi:MAG TPA: hypothetical protein VGC54_03710 [Planctomycetota bacterium]